MPFQLIVEFEFLCAFVPRLNDPEDKRVLVLLPDLRQGLVVGGAAIGNHFAVLRYHRSQGTIINGALPEDPDANQPGLGHRGILLEGCDLRFLPGGKEAPKTAPAFDFTHHLMSMESAATLLGVPGYGEADTLRTTGAMPHGHGVSLAARVTLQGGRLELRQLTGLLFHLHLKGIAPASGLDLGRVSRQVRWTLDVQEELVDVAFKPFGSAAESTLRIQPEGDPTVKIAIRNCEREFKYATGLPGYRNERQELMAFLPLSQAFQSAPQPQQLLMTSRTHTTHGVCSPATFKAQ